MKPTDNKKAQLINKKLHSICEDDATYSVPLGLTKKNEETPILKTSTITIIIDYAPGKSFNLNFTTEKLHQSTSADLFTLALSKLLEIVEEKGLTDVHIDSIVSLETKKRELIIDYFLTLPDKKLDYLQDQIELAFFHKNFISETQESPIESRISLKDFEILAKLGQGGFATVFLARWRKNGRFYALKQIKKGALKPQDRGALLRERNAMLELKCPFLVQIHTAFQTEKCCYFVVDFLAGGDLLHALSKFRKISENACKHIAAEILLGLKGLHDKKYIYRDLKIENVLIDAEGHAHICDFGLAKKVDDINAPNYSLCGTPEFLAPEVYLNTGYNYMNDIYAVGPVIYELVTGKLAFEADNLSDLKIKITKAKPHIPDYLTKELQDLLERLFEKDPTKRIGAKGGVKEVIMHPWFKGIDWAALEKKKVKMPFVLALEKKKFKTLPADFDIENSKDVATTVLASIDEESKREKTRVACFSYYSPLQKAKMNQRKANKEIRAAKKNIKQEKDGEEAKENNDIGNESPGWIGEFDHADFEETQQGPTYRNRLSPYVLEAKLKLMNQIKMENAHHLLNLAQNFSFGQSFTPESNV